MTNKPLLFVILASATLTVMAGAIIAPVLNLMRDSLGVDQASIGFIITTHAIFIAIFSPFVGNIIDRIGTKKPFVFGLILYGLAGGSGLFIDSYRVLIISRVFVGIGVAFILTPITVMILNLYKGAERNKIMGWRASANSAGGIIWPLSGGFLGSFSWHFPFGMYFIGLLLGLVAFVVMPETHPKMEKDISKTGSIFGILRRNPLIIGIYGLFFWAMTLLYAFVIFLPQLLERIGISDPFHISLFIAVSTVTAGFTSLFYGRIRLHLTYKTIIAIALSVWTVAFTAISQTSYASIIAASVALLGIAQGIIMPAGMVLLGEMTESRFRGRVVSYFAAFGFVGQFTSPIIFGGVSLWLGISGVFLVAGVVNAILLLLFLIAANRNYPG
ncbi:MAG: MFS transporter [Candidatus Methanoperedenaceae archaeon]|nr:MFS transporter [Candidatus Methanoperedenaceae archaeon]MDW7726649.1 MFS transporter [Candidatus Methanoperedens sp.]